MEYARVVAQHFFTRVPGIPDKRFVDVFQIGVQVGNGNAFRALLHGLSQLLQGRLGLFLLADVQHDALDVLRLAGRITDQFGLIMKITPMAVAGLQAIVLSVGLALVQGAKCSQNTVAIIRVHQPVP